VAVVRGKDRDGNVCYFVLVSSSEGSASLTKIALAPWETFVGNGQGDAEKQIGIVTQGKGISVVSIGATRPICMDCQGFIHSRPHMRNITFATSLGSR
jgi:hypothetical protein